VVKANAAAVRLFGYAPADLRELQISSLFADPGDWDEVRAQAASGADIGEDGVVFERSMRRADDTRFWCAGNVRPLERGAPERGLMLALMDVDSRHKSEDELKRVRNYLDLVVEHLPVQVSVREVESGRFVSFNRAGEQMTGLTREQVVLYDAFVRDTMERIQRPAEATLSVDIQKTYRILSIPLWEYSLCA